MINHDQPIQGKPDLDTLREMIAREEIETIITAFPDLYGRLIGKRIAGPFFVEEVIEHGVHVCDYVLTADMEMDPVPGYRFASWEQGYGDIHCRPDWNSLRLATWLDKTAIVFCDVYDEDAGDLVEIAPRTVLKRQMERAKDLGFLPMGGAELEMFIFQETYESARQKGFQNLQPFGGYIEDYHILQGTREEPLIGAIRRHLDRSGVPVEFSKGEWGAGQHEINVRYADFLEMSDRSIIFKQVCKEVAMQQSLAVTFMAKWHENAAGNSLHIHSSLWDQDGRSLFAGNGKLPGLPTGASDLFRWYLGGLMAHAREVSLFFAPTVNSYKRYRAGSFAPTSIAWAYDNRTAGFRIVGHGDSLRVECRIPGADANPYLAFAATLAAGLDGIQNQTEPPPAFDGDVYAASELPRVPASLNEAIREFESSTFVRRVFGDQVTDHYLHFARTEQRKFDETVTTWERARFFERI
ncbi:MAG: glutamine synthetase [Anaerolineaceae bacterium 4572_32.2]|nr:MAG: glutamine synthetase [Anaerolineaceae bacterium 4572_32.2]